MSAFYVLCTIHIAIAIMKLLVVVASFYLIVHARRLAPEIIVEWESSLAHVMDECVEITNVDPEIPKTMFRHVHLPDESTFHCFMHCLFHKQGMISSDDQMIIPTMLEKIHSLTPVLAQYCVEETDPIQEPCNRIYELARCIIHDRSDDD